ncbi:MAG: hypothetical protein LBH14_00510, partial [Desulfobulbaceae bacterium]|nr:hypothetical protein [Desulfobulbaceae bacterium]
GKLFLFLILAAVALLFCHNYHYPSEDAISAISYRQRHRLAAWNGRGRVSVATRTSGPSGKRRNRWPPLAK